MSLEIDGSRPDKTSRRSDAYPGGYQLGNPYCFKNEILEFPAKNCDWRRVLRGDRALQGILGGCLLPSQVSIMFWSLDIGLI